ncbi:hypothetical protein [Bacillus sp. FJAT-45350]|nr:hypothetical protein [Bacillus sp. FJAT-45350]
MESTLSSNKEQYVIAGMYETKSSHCTHPIIFVGMCTNTTQLN